MSVVSRDRWGDGPPTLTIAHDIPGRLRLRLPAGARTEGLAEAIDRLPGVRETLWSPRTRSLLVRYEPNALSAPDLTRAAAAHAAVAPPEPDDAPRRAQPDSRSPVALAVTDAVGELNQRVSRLTHGRLDLAILVPLGLALWALRDMTRGPIAPLAWSSALWYAHGLFRDYNPPVAQPRPGER
jgi:hypothetical protein